jgi:ADP-ribose pyrophosphatase
MVDPGEKVTLTLKREFTEEALNGLEMGLTEKERIKGKLDELFAHGQEVCI